LTGHPPDDSALVTFDVDAAAVGDSSMWTVAVGAAEVDSAVLIGGLDWPDPMVVVCFGRGGGVSGSVGLFTLFLF
jgi:hypothetical protein